MIERNTELFGKASRIGDAFKNLYLCYGANLSKVLKDNMNNNTENL